MPELYRKKPVTIEAGQVPPGALVLMSAMPFHGEAQYRYDDGFMVYDQLHDTWVRFIQGDWIIRGIKGEFYPCKDDVFRASYEPVEYYRGARFK